MRAVRRTKQPNPRVAGVMLNAAYQTWQGIGRYGTQYARRLGRQRQTPHCRAAAPPDPLPRQEKELRMAWFESVAEAQRRARKRLPPSVYSALIAGSEKGVTLRDNQAAFDELSFTPKTAGLPEKRDPTTTVMGQSLSMPVLISPTGVQAVCPEGEVAVARAAASRGTAMGLSSFASKPIEQVVAANPATFFQVYWCGTRDEMIARLDRARNAGAVGLILTLDWSFSHSRDWGSPHIPERLTVREALRFAPEALGRPRWLWAYLKTGHVPDLTVPNMVSGGPAPTFFGAYGQWMQTPPPSWDDVRWLREQWDGPFLLKGVYRADEARRAVDAGVTAISVSNHGGNNLDGTPATIRALPAIADAVGDQVEVLLDGGIRRGSDVVKAVALGARAVMIGRAYLWGLAAGGQAGVENVLDILRTGIDSTLLALGHGSIHDLTREDVRLPTGF
jgi:heme/flavin dehydrogenase (mycofactocin system)